MGMFSSLVRFFEGRVGIVADRKNKNALLSFFVNNGISAKAVPYGAEGGIYTEISPRMLKNIAPALDKLNIMVYINNIYGFKRLCSRYAVRYGLLLGCVLFFALLWVSTRFVWRVDVVGAESMSREMIRDELSEMGVREGAAISRIDRALAVNGFLTSHPEISWAALNFKGTTAVLVLRETEEKPSEDEKETSRLLVAAEDGVVRSVLVYEGNAVVKAGTPVKRGDVLISGYISGSGMQITDAPPLRVTEAVGSVKADVIRFVEIEVPFNEQRAEMQKSEKKTRAFSVFGREISFGKTEGLTLESEKNVTFFGVVEIPVTVKTYSRQTETVCSVSRDAQEARLVAEKLLYLRITELAADGELTYVKPEFTETESGWKARAEIGCTVEIAVPYEKELKSG